MKSSTHHSEILTVMLVSLLLSPCWGAGLLKPLNGSADALFLKSHHVNVTINNGFARTEVDQIFGNRRSLYHLWMLLLPGGQKGRKTSCHQ